MPNIIGYILGIKCLTVTGAVAAFGGHSLDTCHVSRVSRKVLNTGPWSGPGLRYLWSPPLRQGGEEEVDRWTHAID